MHRITVRVLLFGCLILDGRIAETAETRHADHPVNIVLITADNLGYGDVGCYGNPVMKPPHIDRLAEQGVRCTDFYTASPTCTVSRASLLTGRYPQRHGLTNQLPGIEGNYGVGLRHSEILLPQLLKAVECGRAPPAGWSAPRADNQLAERVDHSGVGYRTACFGKWNIGFAEGSRPTERGFDEFFGHASGNIDYYTHVYQDKLDLHRGTEPVQVNGYSTDLFADAACEFIRRNSKRPFFVYLPFNAPHYPNPKSKAPGQPCIWQAPQWAFEKYGYAPETTDEKQRYQAVVTALDAAIGRVLKTVDEEGLADRTLVIFYSDNGAFMLPGRGLEVASNKPLRDGGVTLWEGGIRVPCIVRWPGRLPAGTLCREPLISLDLFVMVAKAAGVKLPSPRSPLPVSRGVQPPGSPGVRDWIIDGRDPTATLAGEASSPHEALYFQFRGYSAVRKGRYKLLRTKPDGPFMLFDLSQDIGETTDLAAQNPSLAAELQRDFNHWLAQFE